METTSQPSSTDSATGLGAWTWDPTADDYVRADADIPEEVKEIIGDGPKGVSTEQFERLFNSEKFRRVVAKGLSYGGRVASLETLKVDKDDPAFMEAMEVVYRRLLDGPGQYLLQFMSNDDLVDFFIVSAWAGPFGYAVRQEIQAKKKAAKLAQKEQAEEGGEGEKNEQS